ncbi:MAG: type II secretion system F family protein [Bryobacter sp.]|jgi:tight adherence protein B|nr:type II secretion system F family protein [Bryobacter sp.]
MGFVLLLVFVVCFGAVAAALVVGNERLKAVEGPAEATPTLLKEETVSSISLWAELLEQFDFTARARKLLDEAELDWSVGRLTLMMLLSGASTLVVASRLSFVPPLAAVAVGITGAFLPWFRLQYRRGKRLRRFQQLFPDALDSLSRALRAGHPLAGAMELVAAETPAPVGGEFRRALEEWRLGRGWEQALEKMAHRVPTLNVALFVAAVKLQSKTGGKLNEILFKLSEEMREAQSLEDEIRALAAHGRMTGTVLTIMPIAIGAMMMTVNPNFLAILFGYEHGKLLLAGAGVCIILAHLWIQRILDIKL